MITILLSSIIFYDFQKIDYEHGKESFEIMNDVSKLVNGINRLGIETKHITTIQTINQWPTAYPEMRFDISVISHDNYDNLHDYILNSKAKGLTHIIIDDAENRPIFLRDLFFDESKYNYLKKIYDSKDYGFNYHVKVFEINYQKFS